MPYSSVSDLPANVKKLSSKKQRQWMHIFNAAIKDGKPESKAFAMANGVVKEFTLPLSLEDAELLFETKDYQYVDSYEYRDHAIPQAQAGYNPVGGDNAKACANCQFWIAPSRCAIVAGTISPTGVSDLWHVVVPYTSDPLPVTIVSDLRGGSKDAPIAPAPVGDFDLLAALNADARSRAQRQIQEAAKAFELDLTPIESTVTEPAVEARPTGLLTRIKQAITGAPPTLAPVQGPHGFTTAKQKDGRTRFYTAWSNNFKDREGEIFTKAAHKEFVDWATENSEYPELWIWHTKGSEFGQVDWLDATDDGFVHASGLIHAGKEALAEQLAKEESGVSHGFFGLQQGNVIHMYRSYEISVLPLTNAAVWTTSFNLMNAGKATDEMGFTPQKKEYFKNLGIDDATVAQWEKQTEGLADSLKGLGLESKAADMGIDVPPPPTAEAKAQTEFQVETTKTLMALQETLGTLAGAVKEIQDKTKDIKSGDAVIAAAMTPQATGAVTQASKSTDNVVAQGAPEAQGNLDFFKNTVLGSLITNGTT